MSASSNARTGVGGPCVPSRRQSTTFCGCRAWSATAPSRGRCRPSTPPARLRIPRPTGRPRRRRRLSRPPRTPRPHNEFGARRWSQVRSWSQSGARWRAHGDRREHGATAGRRRIAVTRPPAGPGCALDVRGCSDRTLAGCACTATSQPPPPLPLCGRGRLLSDTTSCLVGDGTHRRRHGATTFSRTNSLTWCSRAPKGPGPAGAPTRTRGRRGGASAQRAREKGEKVPAGDVSKNVPPESRNAARRSVSHRG